ncbi:putative ribonuclease H-like domain-containing protein [Tanacetum coccineum]
MHALEDISIFDFSNDDEDDGAVANMNNLDTTIQVSHIPTTRIHKDHPLEQVIRYLHSTIQIRRMIKNLEEHGFVSTIKQRTNHKDLQNCLFACFLSQEEPKKVIHALKDPSWIEAMQEELLQFKLQEVWTLVYLPNGKRAIGTKWVFRNKKDERGIVIKNKARLLMPHLKTLFVLEWDVKMLSLRKIKEEVYVCQPLGFEDPDFPDRVYKVEKALYGLHQAPRAWYETLSTYLLDNRFQRGKIDKTCLSEEKKMMHKKFQMSSMGELTFFLGLQVKQKKDGIFISQDKYVTDILKKFGFTDVKTASTPMETNKPLLKDEDGEEVDVHYSRQQVNSKSFHLHAMTGFLAIMLGASWIGINNKRFHRLTLDVDLISWQCKKQTVVANSTTEAEYVAASSCRDTVDELWPRVRANEMLPGVSNDVVMEKIRGRVRREKQGRVFTKLGLFQFWAGKSVVRLVREKFSRVVFLKGPLLVKDNTTSSISRRKAPSRGEK